MPFAVSTYQGQSIEFPKHDIDPANKGKDWHKQYCAAIYSVYLRDRAGIKYSKRAEMDMLRLYAEGNQPVEKYMDRLFPIDPKTNTRKGYMNVSWDILSVIPKFRAIVIGMFEKIDHDIVCSAIDPNSQAEKDQMKWSMWAEKQLEGVFGKYDELLENSGFQDMSKAKDMMPSIPKTLEEIEMFMELGAMKIKQEIAMEKAIDWSFYLSSWKDIKRQVFQDFFDIGVGAVKDYVDRNTQRVKSRYVDPKNLVVKYSRSHTHDNIDFVGEITHYSIAELREAMAEEIKRGEITEDDIRSIASKYCGYQGNPYAYEFEYYSHESGNGGYRYDEFKVCVLDCEWFSYDVKKYEKKRRADGEEYVYNKPYTYNKPENENRKKGVSFFKTVHRAKWIPGSDYTFDYGYQYDIPRPNKSDAKLSYHIFKVSNKSMLSSIIPIEDNIQLTWLKLQNALAMAAPAGLAFEFGTLNNMSLGGKKMQPLDILSIRRQTGDLLFKASTHHSQQGSGFSSKPVFPIEGGIGNQLSEFLTLFEHNINMIRQITGISQTMDGSVNPNVPVGTTEMSVAGTNNILHNLWVGYTFLKEETAKNMALRWQIVARYKNVEGHYPALGKNTFEIIKITSKLSFAEYAIKVELRAAEEAKQRLLNAALQSLTAHKQGGVGIKMSDYFFIERQVETGNLKYAQIYLAWREQQEDDKRRAESQENSQVQGEIMERQEYVKGENQRALVEAEKDKEIAIEDAKSQFRMRESDNRFGNEGEVKRTATEAELQKTLAEIEAKRQSDEESAINQQIAREVVQGGRPQ